MNIKLKDSILAVSLGLLGCVNVACNASAEVENEADSNETETQTAVVEQVVEAVDMETVHEPIVLSEEEFAEWVVDFRSSNAKYKGEKPCVIDFYANWCRPCRVLAPMFETMAEKYGDKVNFYKINTDDCKNIAIAYNINSIPTLFFFDKNGTLTRAVGLPSEEEFENAVKTIMQ